MPWPRRLPVAGRLRLELAPVGPACCSYPRHGHVKTADGDWCMPTRAKCRSVLGSTRLRPGFLRGVVTAFHLAFNRARHGDDEWRLCLKSESRCSTRCCLDSHDTKPFAATNMEPCFLRPDMFGHSGPTALVTLRSWPDRSQEDAEGCAWAPRDLARCLAVQGCAESTSVTDSMPVYRERKILLYPQEAAIRCRQQVTQRHLGRADALLPGMAQNRRDLYPGAVAHDWMLGTDACRARHSSRWRVSRFSIMRSYGISRMRARRAQARRWVPSARELENLADGKKSSWLNKPRS